MKQNGKVVNRSVQKLIVLFTTMQAYLYIQARATIILIETEQDWKEEYDLLVSKECFIGLDVDEYCLQNKRFFQIAIADHVFLFGSFVPSSIIAALASFTTLKLGVNIKYDQQLLHKDSLALNHFMDVNTAAKELEHKHFGLRISKGSVCNLFYDYFGVHMEKPDRKTLTEKRDIVLYRAIDAFLPRHLFVQIRETPEKLLAIHLKTLLQLCVVCKKKRRCSQHRCLHLKQIRQTLSDVSLSWKCDAMGIRQFVCTKCIPTYNNRLQEKLLQSKAHWMELPKTEANFQHFCQHLAAERNITL